MRRQLVKDGYDDDKLGSMKMEKIHKLVFMKYVDDYIQWYSYEKTKPETK